MVRPKQTHLTSLWYLPDRHIHIPTRGTSSQQFVETLPKGVPNYVRTNYQYFIFPATDPTDRGGMSYSNSATTSSASTPFWRSPDDGPETEMRNAFHDAAPPLSGPEPIMDVERREGGAGHIADSEVVDHNESDISRSTLQRDPRDDEGQVAGVASAAVATYTLEDCSVCLEGYLPGYRLCRIPCAHILHETVRPVDAF